MKINRWLLQSLFVDSLIAALLFACALVLWPELASSQGVPVLETKEVDGSPSVFPTSQIIYPNGSLTDNGSGSVTISPTAAARNAV